MQELLPGFENEAPIDATVHKEGMYFLTQKRAMRLPLTPPPLQDHGNYVISINKFVKWLGEKVEQAGITIFTGFACSELLFGRNPLTRPPTHAQSVAKHGQPHSNLH